MAGLDPAIHDFLREKQDVDARHKAGHDEKKDKRPGAIPAFFVSSLRAANGSRECKAGLLRGACRHRERIRATRWLAMTATILLSSSGLTGRSSTPRLLDFIPGGGDYWMPAFRGHDE
jgi:hypothetical protein